jgi:hypothetical protein
MNKRLVNSIDRDQVSFLVFYPSNRKRWSLLSGMHALNFTCTVVCGFQPVEHTRVQAVYADFEFAVNARAPPFHVKPLANVAFIPSLCASRRNKLGCRPQPEVTLPATKG